jgi:thiosulfate/3-mercaptopyruvate sulfurtransferase
VQASHIEFGPLINAASLHALIGAPDLCVIDVRWYLGDRRGADEFAHGHIPGAVFVDLDRELTAASGPGRHPIPSAAELTSTMERAGATPGCRVVAYDDVGGAVGARLWWLLRYYGHARVAVLDGGLAAWLSQGHALTKEPMAPVCGTWTAAPPQHDWVVDKDRLIAALAEPTPPLLLDARAPARYRGEFEPVDARPGHIPSAVNAPFADNLANGHFKTPSELRHMYEALGVRNGNEVIAYCGSGVTACHDLLALEIAGLSGARLYEGSFSDWARDSSLPVTLGNEP